jgi:hypothetical protein
MNVSLEGKGTTRELTSNKPSGSFLKLCLNPPLVIKLSKQGGLVN